MCPQHSLHKTVRTKYMHNQIPLSTILNLSLPLLIRCVMVNNCTLCLLTLKDFKCKMGHTSILARGHPKEESPGLKEPVPKLSDCLTSASNAPTGWPDPWPLLQRFARMLDLSTLASNPSEYRLYESPLCFALREHMELTLREEKDVVQPVTSFTQPPSWEELPSPRRAPPEPPTFQKTSPPTVDPEWNTKMFFGTIGKCTTGKLAF